MGIGFDQTANSYHGHDKQTPPDITHIHSIPDPKPSYNFC